MKRSISTFHLVPGVEKSFGYAQATCDGTYVFIAGTTSMDEEFVPLFPGDMRAQMNKTYERIHRTLEAHGAGFQDVLRETLYVTDMEQMLAANDVRLACYGSHTPAATAVEVKRLAFEACMVEIELLALLPRPRVP
jgi:enamine deaminase RidA (YjgF/YER057c/UK114 family)